MVLNPHIPGKLEIPQEELRFKVCRSSGPGGQNVNKVNTRVTVFFDVPASSVLSEPQKKRILRRLGSRTDKNGVVRAASQKYRTQKANRRAAIEKLHQLIQQALKTTPPRKKTVVPAWARRKRLEQKQRRSKLKKLRAQRHFESHTGGSQ